MRNEKIKRSKSNRLTVEHSDEKFNINPAFKTDDLDIEKPPSQEEKSLKKNKERR